MYYLILLFFIIISKEFIKNRITKNITIKKYYQAKLIFEKRINKELLNINSFYKNNKSIKLCRKYITSTHYDKYIDNKTVYLKQCKVISKFKRTFKRILVACHSHISLFYHRHVIRKMYKYFDDIQILFFIGLDHNNQINLMLKEEMDAYRDVILFNFYSNYNNLIYLTYNFILWVKRYKYLYDIIIKQDTDTFLNVILLQKIINTKIKNDSYYVMGYIWHFNNKEKQFPSGMCYIFSSQSVDRLTKNIDDKYIRVINRIHGSAEDVFFGYLAKEAKLSFYDLYYTFHFKSFFHIPDYYIDINNVFMIHDLRVAEIAFFMLIIINNTNNISFKYVL